MTMTEYKSQSARDAQATGYGDSEYWDYLDSASASHYDYFMRHGDPVQAELMMTQPLSGALRGNDGE